MAVDWDREHAYMAQALPTPTDTPYRTPSSSRSRHSLRRRGSSPAPSSSSPPAIDMQDHQDVEDTRADVVDVTNDATFSPMDPRRFTPTLHASLVSEILSLRRDLEGKTRMIDTLEVTLESAKSDAESLGESLSQSSKENRSLKRQLQLLEGGSNSAMSELSKERDDAVDNIADYKRRLEHAQKKSRSQEEEIDRTQTLWENDRHRWDEDRRNLERKVHVVEGRLRTVLNEVAAAQAENSLNRSPEKDHDETTRDGAITRASDNTSIRSNSAFGRRRASTASNGTYDGEPRGIMRYSVMGFNNGQDGKDGLNLAEELAFDEEEEDNMMDDDDYESDRPGSGGTLPEERPASTQSRPMGLKARKILGMSLEGMEQVDGAQRPQSQLKNMDDGLGLGLDDEDGDDDKTSIIPRFEYRDAGIQYTPPPSPKLVPQPVDSGTDMHADDIMGQPFSLKNGERGSNAPYQSKDSCIETVPVDMVSSACQTSNELPSPPSTPKSDEDEEEAAAADLDIIAKPKHVEMQSSCTQTDEIPVGDKEVVQSDPQKDEDAAPCAPIPVIAIHPPGSNPPSPRNSVVLPPQTKNASCQADIRPAVDTCSSGMQTEEIRIDKRPAKIPASLLPSAIPDLDRTDKTPDSPDSLSQPALPPFRAPPPKSARRKLRSPPIVERPPPPKSSTAKGKQPERTQAYPGNNDDGPLAEDKKAKSDIRRPLRSSSLFAGFENDDEPGGPDGSDGMLTDDEIFNRPMASYTLKSGRLVTRTKPMTVDEDPLEGLEGREVPQSPQTISPDEKLSKGSLRRSGTRGRSSGSKRGSRTSQSASSSRQPDIRRTAMISSSAAAHQSSRPRSPSSPDMGEPGPSGNMRPPFPVPVRLSSRKVPTSVSEGSQSPTPNGNGRIRDRRMNDLDLGRERPMRKARSAAAVSKARQIERQPSRSPPTLSPSSAAPDSPQDPPPMPFDDITAPHAKRSGKMSSNRSTRSYSNYSHSRDESTRAASVQPTSVVDAIAQTMVGEWMWKYVRRRKSFGVSDNAKDGWDVGKTTEEVSANITGNGVRHRRWVWLAPYERAVMWSSKQPTSGTALLGKSGRKLTIQSVLDVKDDNPLPKGSSPQNQINRSILILTPQRALKFTAMSQERHFVWLTALSFLSHSSMSFNDLAALPPVPAEDHTPAPSAPVLRRNPIRDSIRVAKGKARPVGNGNRSYSAQPKPVPEMPDENENDPFGDAADPPTVPRFSAHSRKRSNTAPRMPPSSFRSFTNTSHNAAPSTYSNTTAGSSDLHSPSSAPAPGIASAQSSITHRTSEASGPSSVGMSNFFDAVGTVRMEAFVDRTDLPRTRNAHWGRNRTGSNNRRNELGGGNWPYSPDLDLPRSEDGDDSFYRHDDPFGSF